jgi:hypothetical protein
MSFHFFSLFMKLLAKFLTHFLTQFLLCWILLSFQFFFWLHNILGLNSLAFFNLLFLVLWTSMYLLFAFFSLLDLSVFAMQDVLLLSSGNSLFLNFWMLYLLLLLLSLLLLLLRHILLVASYFMELLSKGLLLNVRVLFQFFFILGQMMAYIMLLQLSLFLLLFGQFLLVLQ